MVLHSVFILIVKLKSLYGGDWKNLAEKRNGSVLLENTCIIELTKVVVACSVLMNVVLKITMFIVILLCKYNNEVFRDVSR